MSTDEISRSIKDCDPDSVQTDNESSKQRKHSTHSSQGSLNSNQVSDQAAHKINTSSLEENGDSNIISQDLKNVNKHIDNGVVNENVNSDIKESVNPNDNDQRQSNTDLSSNKQQNQGQPSENTEQKNSQLSTDGDINEDSTLNDKPIIQQHKSVSNEDISKPDDITNSANTGNDKLEQDVKVKEDISELCNVSETNLSEIKSVNEENKPNSQNTHIAVEKTNEDVDSSTVRDKEQDLEVKTEIGEQGDNYEDDFEEAEDQENKLPEDNTDKDVEVRKDDVVSKSHTVPKTDNEEQEDKHKTESSEIEVEDNKISEQPTKVDTELDKDNKTNRSETNTEAKEETKEQGDDYADDFEDDNKPNEETNKEVKELQKEGVSNKPHTDTEATEENQQQGEHYEDDFEETQDEDSKPKETPTTVEREQHNEEVINPSNVDTKDSDKVEHSVEQDIVPNSESNSGNVRSEEKNEEEVVKVDEETLKTTLHESDTKDINDSDKSDVKETDPDECNDKSKLESVQQPTTELSTNDTEIKDNQESNRSDIIDNSEQKNVDVSEPVPKEPESEKGRSESITEPTSESNKGETNQVSKDTKCDTSVDNPDKEQTLTGADQDITETANSEPKDIDTDTTLTKIVVDEEGLPKVAITTVPDRPPSSQASEVDKKETEDPFSDFDTFTDDPSKTMSETGEVSNKQENNEIDQQKEAEHETDAPKITRDGNSTEPNEEAKAETNQDSESDKQQPGDAPKTDDCEYLGAEQDTPRTETPSRVDDASENIEKVGAKDENETNVTHAEEKSEEQTAIKKDDEQDKKPEPVVEKPPTPEPVVEKPPTPEPVVKQESPLEQLLKRNVEIDGTIDSVISLETNVTSLLGSMKDVMKHYSELLKLQPLKDFTSDLGKFRGDFTSINEAFKQCTTMSMNMNQQLKELRHVTEDVRSQIHRKFQQEDLSTWVDITPDEQKEKERLQEETYAAEKAAMAKATEARHAVSVATAGVSESHQLIAQMETQVAEAEAVSVKAAAQAHTALIVAEEARKAAEERRQAEEASKKRAEERARIKAAEEEKKKAQEEMTIYQEAAKKGTSVEDERQQFMEEKSRKEEERKNPKNWPTYVFALSGVDFNPTTACIIRAIDGSMRKTDVTCSYIDQSTGSLTLKDNEELISNIVCVKQVEEDRKFSFDEPMSVSVPVCIGRVPGGKEMVVKQLLPNGNWKELPSAEVQFEDYRETKFIEARCNSVGTFIAVLRPKRDKLQFVKRGGKLFCSSDSRISFTSKPGTFKQAVNAILEVQTLDGQVVSDLRSRAPAECGDLLTSSSFINFSLPMKKLEKPLVVTLPLPLVQTRQKRPATGIARETKSQDLRPQTARQSAAPSSEEDTTERIYFLHRDDKSGWSVNSGVNLVQPKNKDVACFEISQSYERMVLLRTKAGKRDSAIEKMATLLEKMSTQRSAKLVLRQRHDDVSDVTIACTTSNRTDRVLKYLEDNGFTEGPNPSPDLVVQEGQQLYVKFRGNIERVDSKSTINFIYNTNIRGTREFKVNEIDEFAQKSLPSYRGFVQVYTKAMVPKPIPDGAAKNVAPEMVEAEVLLAELLVELPKPEVEPPKPLATAPLHLKEGPLTNGYMRQLAGMMGKEWKDVAAQLNVKPMRIQAILRNHVNKDTPAARFDMLVTWAKRVPKAVDKVQILCSALVACGRLDLADEVKHRGQQYKQQRFMSARVSHLRQAFVKVAKCAAVFNRWKEFAKNIGVPEDKIRTIEESGGSGQEKCFSSLETWKDSKGEEATITALSNHLKSAKQDRLAREVESVIA